jgi:light-regulated signal transduction histidine kinase (bacteriophytochrome)
LAAFDGQYAGVTLDNCDQEPIHIPGAIQRHGALLAIQERGVITHASANAAEVLGAPVSLGAPWTDWLAQAPAGWQDSLRLPEPSELPCRLTAKCPSGRVVDVLWSAQPQGWVLELELTPASLTAVGHDAAGSGAPAVHALCERVIRAPDLERLLQWVADGVRRATGFDRVMAYRFRHDDSGEVVAESCVDGIVPFLGRMYPASDIPAQARRLYTLKMLRGIADVHAEPVAVIGLPDAPPLDMSHGELRSVSPVHIEYLQNMGVGASMSLSIVVQGRLWGLVACHHHSAHRVSVPTRMALEVMACLLGARVDEWQRKALLARQAQVKAFSARLSLEMARRGDTLAVLAQQASLWMAHWQASGWLVCLDGVVQSSQPDWVAHWPQLLEWLSAQPANMPYSHQSKDWPSDGFGMAGLLALRFSDVQQAWVCLFRPEQVHTLRWGGKPEKLVKIGPLGPRLTPRGSFDEWRQEVKGTAVPFSAEDLALAEQMRQTLYRVRAELALERKGDA